MLLLALVEFPMIPWLHATVAPLLTTSRFPLPDWPTTTSDWLFQSEPVPLTTAMLLLALVEIPMVPWLSATCAPFLTSSLLNAPLMPTESDWSISQRAVALTSRTSLDLAVAFWPIWPTPVLVSRQLSASTSEVNEPLAPTVTELLKMFVTSLNVLVAPSATSWARSG